MTQIFQVITATDIDIGINITGISVTGLTEIEVSLVENSGITKVFRKSSGQVRVNGTGVTLMIDKTDVTAPGIYSIQIRVTDILNNVRGLTIQDYDRLQFN